jgi:hypothetical protein
MIYARAFFDLQLECAETVSRLSGRPLAETLLDYTNFYIRFALGRGFDPDHPGWQEYVAGLRDAHDRSEWTHRFYVGRSQAKAGPDVTATFGCFAYAPFGPDRVRLHFENHERGGVSPLAVERRGERLADLAELFAHLKRTTPQAPRIIGASWLYNLDAYRCLFPKPYLATARVIRGRFRHMPLWGQFLNRRGDVKERAAGEFRERLHHLPSLDGLDRCFPLPLLGLEASAPEFYAFYGV